MLHSLASSYFLPSDVKVRGPGQLSRYSDSLRAGRSRHRIALGVRISAPVQTGPGAHPTSCTTGKAAEQWR